MPALQETPDDCRTATATNSYARYQQIASLTDYLLIAQNEPRIEHFARRPDNRWLLSTASGSDATIPIASIDCRLILSEVYDKVGFVTTPGAWRPGI